MDTPKIADILKHHVHNQPNELSGSQIIYISIWSCQSLRLMIFMPRCHHFLEEISARFLLRFQNHPGTYEWTYSSPPQKKLRTRFHLQNKFNAFSSFLEKSRCFLTTRKKHAQLFHAKKWVCPTTTPKAIDVLVAMYRLVTHGCGSLRSRVGAKKQ